VRGGRRRGRGGGAGGSDGGETTGMRAACVRPPSLWASKKEAPPDGEAKFAASGSVLQARQPRRRVSVLPNFSLTRRRYRSFVVEHPGHGERGALLPKR